MQYLAFITYGMREILLVKTVIIYNVWWTTSCMCLYLCVLFTLCKSYTTETSVTYCWGGELILSPVRLTPQLYRLWCFSCRFSRSSGWRRSIVLGTVWLKLNATVVMIGPWVVHCLVVFVYGSCRLWHLYLWASPWVCI
jgi:hypothetical protein